MKKNIIKNVKDWKAEQRKKAIELYDKGWKQAKIAEAIGVSQASVSLWIKKAQTYGLESLQTKYSPGAPCKLTLEQKQELGEMLSKEPKCFGFVGAFWARKQVVELIKLKFNVPYDPSQVSRIMKALTNTRFKNERLSKTNTAKL